MNNTDSEDPGGSDAAATSKSLKLTSNQRRRLPLWADAFDYVAQIKWHAEGGFYYATPEDLERGLSFTEARKLPLSEIRRVNYDFGRYGILPVALIGGEAWCSLNAAGNIVGIPTMSVTGLLSGNYFNVRGFPGYLKPDGLRCLNSHGIGDTGIRLEALTAHVKSRRRDDPSVINMLERAILDIYGRDWPTTVSDPIPVVDLYSMNCLAPEKGHVAHRYYDSDVGEMRAVVLGLQVWLLAADVALQAAFRKRVLLDIAGKERTLRIPRIRINGHETPAQVQAFIRFDAVEKFSSALEWELPIIEHVRGWVERDLLHPAKLLERGEHVMARSLHKMLGGHLDFDHWSLQAQTLHGDGQLAEACLHESRDTPGTSEYKIPLSVACKVAEDAKTFAGIVTSKLLREGGFLHGGTIDEPANDTLVRFFDLSPDPRGFVKLRKVWEFLNPKDTFEEWVAERREFGYELNGLPDSEIVSIWGPWCRGIWPTD